MISLAFGSSSEKSCFHHKLFVTLLSVVVMCIKVRQLAIFNPHYSTQLFPTLSVGGCLHEDSAPGAMQTAVLIVTAIFCWPLAALLAFCFFGRFTQALLLACPDCLPFDILR